jgi:GNAT superfamily N-acetyltransferase
VRVVDFDRDVALRACFRALAPPRETPAPGASPWPPDPEPDDAGVDAGAWRLFLTLDGDTPLSRIGAAFDDRVRDRRGRPVARLGFLGGSDDPATVSALVAAALDWLRGRAPADALVAAPMSFDTWRPYRFRTSGFDQPSFPGEPDNPPTYPGRLRTCGFRFVERYVTKTVDTPARLADVWAPHLDHIRRRGFALQVGVGPEVRQSDPAWLHRLVHAAFASQPYFSPLDAGDFMVRFGGGGAASELVTVATPGGQAVGFAYGFVHPGDPTVGCVKTLGVVPDWRDTGIAAALACAIYQRLLARGVSTIHHCLMRAEGDVARFDRGAARVTRTYALLARRLG